MHKPPPPASAKEGDRCFASVVEVPSPFTVADTAAALAEDIAAFSRYFAGLQLSR